MFNLTRMLTFEYEIENNFEYSLSVKKKFTTPKIYTGNGSLKKRWYVYFSFRDPQTGNLKRMKPIYANSSTHKTKEDRLTLLTSYRKNLLQLLKEGFNPFEDNTELFSNRYKDHHLKHKKELQNDLTQIKEPKKVAEHITIQINKVEDTTPEKLEEAKMTVSEAFQFGLNLKKQVLSPSSWRGLNNRMHKFLLWIETDKPQIKTIDQLHKKEINEFLNHILEKTSARNRNNFKADLSSVVQTLEDNEIVIINFVKNISNLKSIPERNKTYSLELQEKIFEYLEENDPILLLFIQFVCYNFLRPIEVSRLKIKNLNIAEKKIAFKAKNSPLKTKIIPDILLNKLPDLTHLNPEDSLFTPHQIGGIWDTNEIDKRNYFSKRYKLVKDHFNLDKNYTLYSFRHTFITKLYRQLVMGSTPYEAKSRLMLITGHATMEALQKYLRDIDAELPEDYSEFLK